MTALEVQVYFIVKQHNDMVNLKEQFKDGPVVIK